ncbi:hypothetical protein D3C72_1354380 [compost metagenome]
MGDGDDEQQADHAQQGGASHGALLAEALGDQCGRNVGQQRADPDQGGDQPGGSYRCALVARGERDDGKDGAITDAVQQRRAERRHGDLPEIERIGLRHGGMMRARPLADRHADARGTGPAAIGAGSRECSGSASRAAVSRLKAVRRLPAVRRIVSRQTGGRTPDVHPSIRLGIRFGRVRLIAVLGDQAQAFDEQAPVFLGQASKQLIFHHHIARHHSA